MNEKFDINTDEDDLIETFEMWLKESETYHGEMLKAQERSLEYYNGNQTDRDAIPTHEPNTVENRVFEGVETLVPVATTNAHQFIVLPGSDTEKSVEKAEKLQKVLSRKYHTLGIQEKLEWTTRDILLMRFGVLKYCWSEVKDDIDVEYKDPRDIFVPKLKVRDPHELPYVIELQEYSEKEMEEYFPDADLEDLGPTMGNKTGQGENAYNRKIYRVYEVWTDEMVAWICNKKLLEKKPNPYWDFEGDEKKEIVAVTKEGKLKRKPRMFFRNHLDKPEKPYVFFATFNVSKGPLPETCLIETAMPLQDDINTQKRQIQLNLRQMGNGQVVMDADAMSEEEAANITNETGLMIRGESIASGNKYRRDPGLPLPNSHFSNLQHSEATFDNILGTHSATRGQAQAKTLGQDMLSRQQDYSRIDLVTRILNRGVNKLANGLVQLMKLYYTDTHVIKILGEEATVEFIRLNRDDIEDHVEIEVKDGNTLPMDEVQLRNEAVQLWQLQALDPVTLYERLKFPNPEKAAERLIAWTQGQLTMESNARIQEAQATAQVAPPPAAKGTDNLKKPERGVETPANVMQRATQGMGGTAPTPKGTPKQ
jgi:hypothetical protein